MGIYDTFQKYYYAWGGHFRGKYDKVIAYGIILLLFFFSILDTCLVWANYRDLLDPGFRFALVTGHAGDKAVMAIYVLAILSTIFCVLECINITSMMLNGGHAKFPVELEQAIVLLLEGIPVASVNLSIVMCRQDSATYHQMVGVFVTVLKSGLRMHFYGWFKEHYFKYERSMYRWTLKIAIYVSASVTWVMLFMIQCFTWHHANVGGAYTASTEFARVSALSGISVVLVHEHDFDHDKVTRHIGSYFSRDIEYCRERKAIYFTNDTSEEVWERSVVVKNLSDIVQSGASGYEFVYGCHSEDHLNNNTWDIPQCKGVDALKFTFLYRFWSNRTDAQPFGEIIYKLAAIQDSGTCNPINETVGNGWELHFFKIAQVENSTDSRDTTDYGHLGSALCTPAELQQPWGSICFPPIPHFNRQLDPCARRDE